MAKVLPHDDPKAVHAADDNGHPACMEDTMHTRTLPASNRLRDVTCAMCVTAAVDDQPASFARRVSLR